MFKAYQEPPKPSYDWTDMLVEKGIPLLGAGAGAIAGGLLAGPAGIAPGMAIGSGLGNTISGLASEKPTSEAKMGIGMKGAMKGYQDWQQLPPEKKLDTDDKGKVPGMPTGDDLVKISKIAPTTEDELLQKTKYQSSYAPMFAKGTLF